MLAKGPRVGGGLLEAMVGRVSPSPTGLPATTLGETLHTNFKGKQLYLNFWFAQKELKFVFKPPNFRLMLPDLLVSWLELV